MSFSVLFSEVKKLADKKKNNSSGKGKKSNPKSIKKSSLKKTSSTKNSPAKRPKQTKANIQKHRTVKGVIIFMISILMFLIYFVPGEKLWLLIHQIFGGVFGILGFMLPMITMYISMQYFKERPVKNLRRKIILLLLVPIILSSSVYSFGVGTDELGGYFTEIQKAFVKAVEYKGGGFIGSILGIPITKLMGSTGGGIIFLFMLIVNVSLVFEAFLVHTVNHIKKTGQRANKRIIQKKNVHKKIREGQQKIKDEERRKADEEKVKLELEKAQQKAQNKRKSGAPENFNRINRSVFYKPNDTEEIIKPQQPRQQSQPKVSKAKPQKTPEPVENKEINNSEQSIKSTRKPISKPVSKPINTDYEDGFDEGDSGMPIFAKNLNVSGISINPESIKKKPFRYSPEPEPQYETYQKSNTASKPKNVNKPQKQPSVKKTTGKLNNSIIEGQYIKPPFTLLEPQPKENDKDISMEFNQRGTMLVDTLKSFGVQATIVNISRGPSVTRYELQPAAGVKISKITNLADDIAMNLAAIGVRIEAPIPGKSAVGIEVPNKNVSVVKMRNLVESEEFQNAPSKLTVALGKDITGKITLADLAKMPHLLIAGSTGSGKSVCINSMLVSLLYKANPDEVKLMLIDPKVVELGVYNGIPHLLVPVVTDPRKAAGALNWAVSEMLKRYQTFAEYNVRDMNSYNRMVERQNSEMELQDLAADELVENSFEEDEMLSKAKAQTENGNSTDTPPKNKPLEKMPQIVIVIDELADLMMAAPNEVEESICRLAQMARAAGMHLVIATQRPSVDVITGLIKANVPSRIAFAVKSQIDSRTILDGSGAEKLLGRGDMLFSPIGTTKPIRVQGGFVDDTEIENIINFIKQNKVVEYDKNVIDEIEKNAAAEKSSKNSADSSDGDTDPMLEEAMRCVIEAGQASTSMLQRRLRVGYARAGRLIDEMEKMGIIGPHEGAKPRQVLMTHQQWLERNMKKSEDE